jgi:hypothetical protein
VKKNEARREELRDKMLVSGNTSMFNEEANKNYFSDKKNKAALQFSRMGK